LRELETVSDQSRLEPKEFSMPDLVRLYIRHVAIGFALAAVFTGLLLWFNVANLWHLVTHAPGGALAAILLVLFNGIVFSGVQFGIAITAMAKESDQDGDGGKGEGQIVGSLPVQQPVAIRVRQQHPRDVRLG
jgi:hypothetical protein